MTVSAPAGLSASKWARRPEQTAKLNVPAFEHSTPSCLLLHGDGFAASGETGRSSIYRVYIKRAAEETGLKKRIGWHTFRHTFGTILNANGENPKVIQELLRHANLRVTMDTYVQAVSNEKREAQSRVVRLLSPGLGKKLV